MVLSHLRDSSTVYWRNVVLNVCRTHVMKVTSQQLRPASEAEGTLHNMDLTTAKLLSSKMENVTEQL